MKSIHDYKRRLKSYLLHVSHVLLKPLSDKYYIMFQYRRITGKKLDLTHPRTFNEKLQVYKLYYRNDIMHQCVDKIEVRQYVTQKLGAERANDILIPMFAYGDSFDEIDWDRLPNRFIIKLSNAYSFNKIILDKRKENREQIKKMFDKFAKSDHYYVAREWAYKGVKNRVLVEQLIEHEGELPEDYKFFCFDGKVECIAVSSGSMTNAKKNHNFMKNIYDINWQLIDARMDQENNPVLDAKPTRFDDMIAIAEKLSEDFPHARIDFYYVNHKIYFGEITFYHGAGYQPTEPETFELRLGDRLNIDSFRKEK